MLSECYGRVPTCDDIDRMKTAIQNLVDGERSMIPTAVRFGKKTGPKMGHFLKNNLF
jgi:hypothetical protein